MQGVTAVGSQASTPPLKGSGATYLMKWPQMPPFPVKKGGIWGHFIKYIAPDPFSGGTEACDPTAVTPCVVSLVK